MTPLVPVLLLAHGLAHLVEFAGEFRLVPQLVPQPFILAGRMKVGDKAARFFGALWLLCALGFAVAAGGAVLQMSWWPSLVFVVCPLSLLLSLMFWPETQLGVPINLLILGVMLFSRWSGWPLPGN